MQIIFVFPNVLKINSLIRDIVNACKDFIELMVNVRLAQLGLSTTTLTKIVKLYVM